MSAPDAMRAVEIGLELPHDSPALVVSAAGRVALESRPVPRPGAGQLLVQTEYSGVSVGTEMWAATGRVEWTPMPFVPGYQAVGRVVALGDESPEVGLTVGDLVACFAMGAHQRYVVASTSLTHRIEFNERLPTAALFVQPAVGANALNMADVQAGDSVMVIGQGLIGQTTAQVARLRGAYVVGTEVSPERIEFSRAHCVDRVIDTSTALASEQVAEQFPDGVDVVIESTGVTPVDDAMRCVRRGGTVVFEGYYPDGVTFDFAIPHEKEVKAVFPSFIGGRNCREGILRLLTNGVLDLHPLISHLVCWRDAADIYNQLFTSERNRFNGVIFDWRGSQ
ncbi:zinc-dependent alcohol dehydrogenase [Phytoactinopolyspora endophytica]|uniref:zinc-dependent alcohol dehydrogenase n=1 Tax=Phytoactinopolyspora endophytica TaxID=1642495 RepID=UPI00101B6F94|nr:zinc-binding dehydrogenase [Phytoactinopolyspora endophytica]